MERRVDRSHGQHPQPSPLPATGVGERWLPLAIGLVLLIAIPLLFVSRGEQSEWNDCFVTAAQHFAARESICNHGESYAYPPSMTLLSFGIGVLPLRWSLLVWGLVNVAATVVTMVGCWRLIGAPRGTNLPRRWWAIALLGTVLAIRWIVSPLEHQQFDMVIAACVVWGCWWLVQRRDWEGGLLIGVGASMKLTPLLFAPYLAWRGQWRAALLVVATVVALNIVPDVVWPQRDGGSYVVDWYQVFLADVRAAAPGTWHSDITLNQSLGGLFNRLYRVGFPSTASNLDAIAITSETAQQLKWLTHGVGLLLGLTTMLLGGRPFRAPAADDQPTRRDWLWTVEFAAIVSLMLLLSPMSSKAHYVVLWLPCLVIARDCLERPSVGRSGLVGLLLLSGTLASKGLVGKTLGDMTLIWGLPTWHVLLTLVMLWESHLSARRDDRFVEPDRDESSAAMARPVTVTARSPSQVIR